MRYNLLLGSLFLCSLNVHAQFKGYAKQTMDKRPDADIVSNILNRQFAKTTIAQKTSGALKRLSAYAYATNNVVQDSASFIYSNDRGSTHSGLSSYANYYSPVGVDVTQNIKCDTYFHTHYYQGTPYLTTFVCNYDNQNQVKEYQGILNVGYVYGYQLSWANNRLEKVTEIDFNASPNVPLSYQYNNYDNQNQKIWDSTYSVLDNRPERKREYTYDAKSNRTSYTYYRYDTTQMQLIKNYVAHYTYDNNDRLIKTVTEGDDGGGWTLQSMDSFAYIGTSMQYTYYSISSWSNSNSKWDPQEFYLYTLNSNGDVNNYIIHSWANNAWDTLEKDVCAYNSDNLLTSIKGYVYSGGMFNTTPYDGTDYYYEEYFPAGIKDKLEKLNLVQVYPNPASGILNIYSPKSFRANLIITNNLGQLMDTQREVNIQSNVVDISNYPAGNYMLNITDTQGVRIHQQLFTKQ